jgi:hypothetical protein
MQLVGINEMQGEILRKPQKLNENGIITNFKGYTRS